MLKRCFIRFYGDLKDLLPEEKRKQYEISFTVSPGIKDIVESEGVPHTEVEFITVNGNPVPWTYRVKDNDYIAVYPFFKSISIKSESKIIEKNYPEGIFILDVHLGKLAKYLRLLGFDADYKREWDDPKIIEIAIREKRIILTRDRGILKNNKVKYGYLIRHTQSTEQVKEVLERFNLKDKIKPFTRCLECNETILPVSKQEVLEDIEENARLYYNEFFKCKGCKKVYWKGSHYSRMIDKLKMFMD